MIRRGFKLLSFALLAWIMGPGSVLPAADTDTESLQPELVSFPSRDLTLQGFIFKPAGKGPFPAILYNHGSNRLPGTCMPLAQFWTSHGFVFFYPHRSGHGRSPGAWILEEQQKFRDGEAEPAANRKHTVELHERANLDVVAALVWLKQQPYVDTNRIVMSGISYGGIQTVLAAEKDLGVQAFVPFGPAAMSWKGNPLLRARLLQAVKNAKAPIFLLQAQNDYDLGPSESLGEELKRKGPPNRVKIYPAFGNPDDHTDGHGGFAIHGSEVWADDVLAFVKEAFDRNATSREPASDGNKLRSN